jgi:hypothetical protein
MVNTDTVLAVPYSLRSVLPSLVVKVEQYFGSFVRLDCASAAGESFEVRVYLADWVFLTKEVSLADSAGAAVANNAKLVLLKGEKLLQVDVRSSNELWLMFTGDMSLKLMANLNEYEPDDELLVTSLDVAFLKFSPTKGFVVAPPVRTEH